MNNSIKQKIIFFITKSNWGGAQKYVYDLALETKKLGFDTSVCLGGNGELINKLEESNIRVIKISSLERDISFLKEIRVFIKIKKILNKEKPDIVHLNSSKIGGIGSLAAKSEHIRKIIFTAHGWAFNEKVSTISKIFRRMLSQITFILCTDVIVLSQKEKEQVSNWPNVKNKISLIPIGLKDNEYLDKESALEKLITLKNNLILEKSNIIIGTIAELHKNKGLDIAIKAMSDLENKNIKFVIIGEGEEFENLKEKVKKQNLKKKVFLIGKIENASKLIKAFDIFLISSRKEGLPYTLLESGLAEIPTIATNVGGIPEIIEHRKNGLLIEPENSTEIIEAIDFMLSNPKEAEQMSKELKETVESSFSFEKMKKETIALYEA